MWALGPIYCLLNFDKDDFCKLIDAIGLDKWLAKKEHWKRLDIAEQELAAKEHYLGAKIRLEELDAERRKLIQIVDGYHKQHAAINPGE